MAITSLESEAARCIFPQSNPTARDIKTELDALALNHVGRAGCYLDTVEGMSGGVTEGEDHHQGLARTHKLADGSIWFFLSHSETDEGDQGSLSTAIPARRRASTSSIRAR